jgi:hypothetical protein
MMPLATPSVDEERIVAEMTSKDEVVKVVWR